MNSGEQEGKEYVGLKYIIYKLETRHKIYWRREIMNGIFHYLAPRSEEQQIQLPPPSSHTCES
jgi:hypothetical protein